MSQKVMFKTAAFGGFEKKAVLDYIMQLSKTSEDAQTELGEQLRAAAETRRQLEQSVQQAESQAQQLQTELEAAARDLDSERARSADLSSMVEHLSGELEQLRQLTAQREVEAEEAQRQMAEMAERTRALESKRHEIDQVSAQIGKMLVDARTDADQLIAEAKAKVQQIHKKARREAQENLVQATMRAREMEFKAQQSAEFIGQQFGRFRREMEGAERNVQETVTILQDRMSSLNLMLESLEEKFSRETAPDEEPQPDVEVLAEALQVVEEEWAGTEQAAVAQIEQIQETAPAAEPTVPQPGTEETQPLSYTYQPAPAQEAAAAPAQAAEEGASFYFQ